MAEDNTILVGSKPAMNYVLAVITQFNSGSKKVIVRNKFLPKIKVKDIISRFQPIFGVQKGDQPTSQR
ncbi:MAG: hypothetical protein PHD13_06085 [Methanocellales archaeon]|nr:hypothetical protein [Methanocellales archaeon]MDD3292208.1 hypothetical protein [Methanocellales archaeon]MDD5235725.1 hypothetical protein [Methanocellales archaeon]MDD5485790.1 hypothetical protein [Methanocellales archaeon]